MKEDRRPRIGISVGDINGIGVEIIIKSLIDKRILDICTPIIYGSTGLINFNRKALHVGDFSVSEIEDAEEAKRNKVNVIKAWEKDPEVNFGKPSSVAGKHAFLSLEAAMNDIKEQKIEALITAPINKATINSKEFPFHGHTDYLGAKDENEPLMILAGEDLKVAMVTGHVPLSEVKSHITVDNLVSKIEKLNKALIEDFGLQKPKIAVLGLNPHAGDDGLLGKEEIEVIQPAIEQVKTKQIVALGPYPADGFFGASQYREFDAVLAMYHDQALIPFKTLSFESGVNYTAGLSFVRTSPDHGTAFGLAGHNKASEQSFRNAIYMACDVLRLRKHHMELNNKTPEPSIS